MSGCLLCLHLDLGLKTGFEFKVEVVFVNRDPFDQPPDHPFIVIRHRFLMLIQERSCPAPRYKPHQNSVLI